MSNIDTAAARHQRIEQRRTAGEQKRRVRRQPHTDRLQQRLAGKQFTASTSGYKIIESDKAGRQVSA